MIVVSWSWGCASGSSYGINARVSYAHDWIQELKCSLSSYPPDSCSNQNVSNSSIDQPAYSHSLLSIVTPATNHPKTTPIIRQPINRRLVLQQITPKISTNTLTTNLLTFIALLFFPTNPNKPKPKFPHESLNNYIREFCHESPIESLKNSLTPNANAISPTNPTTNSFANPPTNNPTDLPTTPPTSSPPPLPPTSPPSSNPTTAHPAPNPTSAPPTNAPTAHVPTSSRPTALSNTSDATLGEGKNGTFVVMLNNSTFSVHNDTYIPANGTLDDNFSTDMPSSEFVDTFGDSVGEEEITVLSWSRLGAESSRSFATALGLPRAVLVLCLSLYF